MTASTSLKLSYEFFPPKTDKGKPLFWQALEATDRCPDRPKPLFHSITYGALGSGRQKSIDTVLECAKHVDTPIAAHITAAGQSRADADEIVQRWYDAGIRRLVVLRGDADIHPDGYQDAIELIRGVREIGYFDISVAAYPETHPKAQSRAADLDVLQSKLDAGADRALTQFFFEAAPFLKLRDEMAARGIDQPIVPGILPIQNFKKIQSFATACGTAIPKSVEAAFEQAANSVDHDAAQKQVGIEVATQLCKDLIAEGVQQFHFYTLNTGEASRAVVKNLMTMR